MTSESRNSQDPENGMSFWGHLEVLRHVIMRCGAAVIICMIGCFIAMPHIFDRFILGAASPDFFLYRWLSGIWGDRAEDTSSHGNALSGLMPDFGGDFSVDIINVNVASQFTTHISTSFWLALVIVFPYIIYELWRFIMPALYPSEKRNIGSAFIFGTGMFYIGCAVGYSIVFPLTFRFLAGYELSGEITNMISLDSYIGNFLMMVFIMGLVFEIPLLSRLLSSMGIIDRAFLRKFRRHAIVLLMVLAAVITPSGDPFTLMVVFLPLYLLYEIAILVARK